jgi:octaprenyl-diphosphate synthase
MPTPHPLAAGASRAGELLAHLGAVCRRRGLHELAERLVALRSIVDEDLAAIEAALADIPRGGAVVLRSAAHLLDLGGKRLRPLCVALAARTGDGFNGRARQLAAAAELVHSATLLHDDVVDLGQLRRGSPTANAVYGNAAAIFAGDWLLVDALRRVRQADVPGTLDRLLAVIDEMIRAESIQLEARGRIVADRGEYFRIVEGKTASLFRWAMFAGARAGGLDEVGCAALETYGVHLGTAFQLVDDILDVAGDPMLTGKALFADLREGKTTYPLLVALEKEPALEPTVAAVAADEGALTPEVARRIVEALIASGGIDACRALAEEHAARAAAALAPIPRGQARDALEAVAEASVNRGL